MLVLVLAQTSGWTSPVFSNATPWQVLERGPITVEAREIPPGSSNEYRVTTQTDLSPNELCDVVFEWGTHQQDNPGTQHLVLLRDGTDERVVYSQLGNRDYAMTVMRQRESATGVCRIRFVASNELAPAPRPDLVRMERLWGSWEFAPLGDGHTLVTYAAFADPAGSLPTFLVNRGQRTAATDTVKLALERARRNTSAKR